MELDENGDNKSFHADFSMELDEPNKKMNKLESPVFDAETDDFLLKIDQRIMDGEQVEIPTLNKPKEQNTTNSNKKADLLRYIDQGQNENTRKKTERDARRFTDFMKVRGEEREITEIPRPDLENHLGVFFMELKKPNGEQYEPSTITSIHSSIDRYLRMRGCQYSIKTCAEFRVSQDVIRTKRKIAKQDGLGNMPNRAEALCPDDEERLWATGQMGAHSPIALLRALWYLTSKLMGFRGRDESRKMRWGDMNLGEDRIGKYLEFTERATKTRTGESNDVRATIPRAYANLKNAERCPVELYIIYKSHRPLSTLNDHAPFYLAVNNMRKDPTKTRSWYKAAPLGRNSIGLFLRSMANGAGLTGKFTNHTVRKTSITNLLQAGLPPTMIQQISGHKDVKSISNYATASREQIAQMNQILHDPQQIQRRASATLTRAEIPSPNENRASATLTRAEIPPPNENRALGEENIAPDTELALAPVGNDDRQMNTFRNATMMMADSSTSGLFHNARFENCTFNMSFKN